MGKQKWESGANCDLLSRVSQTRVSRENREGARKPLSRADGERTRIGRYLDIEVGRVTKHSSDGLSLALHIDLLDLPGFEVIIFSCGRLFCKGC